MAHVGKLAFARGKMIVVVGFVSSHQKEATDEKLQKLTETRRTRIDSSDTTVHTRGERE